MTSLPKGTPSNQTRRFKITALIVLVWICGIQTSLAASYEAKPSPGLAFSDSDLAKAKAKAKARLEVSTGHVMTLGQVEAWNDWCLEVKADKPASTTLGETDSTPPAHTLIYPQSLSAIFNGKSLSSDDWVEILVFLLIHEWMHVPTSASGGYPGGGVSGSQEFGGHDIPTADHVGLQYWSVWLACERAEELDPSDPVEELLRELLCRYVRSSGDAVFHLDEWKKRIRDMHDVDTVPGPGTWGVPNSILNMASWCPVCAGGA